jgi:preprotein translocase subunit Sec61beta
MTNSSGEKIALTARYALLAGIVLFGGLLLTKLRNENGTTPSGLPKIMSVAQAETIAAAPGYLLLSTDVGGNRKFYIFDSGKKVICVYSLTGDSLRLVSAREISEDLKIADTSIDVRTPSGVVIRSPEGGSGINREQAKQYGAGLQKYLEEEEKRLRK